MLDEIEEIKLLRLFSSNLDSNLNLNKEQVKNIIKYINELEKYYSYYMDLLEKLGDYFET